MNCDGEDSGRSRLRDGSNIRNSIIDTLRLRCLLHIWLATRSVSLETLGGVLSSILRNH